VKKYNIREDRDLRSTVRTTPPYESRASIRNRFAVDSFASNLAEKLRKNPKYGFGATEGWVDDAQSSMWQYFKPMIPWILLSNIVTAIIIWKVAGTICKGRLLVDDISDKARDTWRATKSKVGAAKSRLKKPYKRKN
jgi:hypothetical protein